MRKRYLFFDVDGTLIAGGSYAKNYIPESTRRAIELLRADGHFLCLATGRSEAMARGYMQELGFDNMVSDGGYGITIEGKLLGIKPLPKDKMIALLKECESRGIPWAIQPDNSVTRLAPDGRFYDFTHDTYQETRTVPGLDPESFENLYKAFIYDVIYGKHIPFKRLKGPDRQRFRALDSDHQAVFHAGSRSGVTGCPKQRNRQDQRQKTKNTFPDRYHNHVSPFPRIVWSGPGEAGRAEAFFRLPK